MKKPTQISKRKLPALSQDPYLRPYFGQIQRRSDNAILLEKKLTGKNMPLEDFASAHEYYGLHKKDDCWQLTEWAPNATAIFLIGDFNGWHEDNAFLLKRAGNHGDWQIKLPLSAIKHGQLYKFKIHWHGGSGDRIPAYCRRVVQDHHTKVFSAQAWDPIPYIWKNNFTRKDTAPLIYESHVGMAQEKEGVGTYTEFRELVLPRIMNAGYNTIQLMAVMEHPYYGSFGYHVSNLFAASSRFGTPEELKELIDAAHGLGIAIIIDIIHSHHVSNELEGLSKFDGSTHQYFHEGDRGKHVAWDSRCFDYGKTEVLHLLLSNCRYWLDEFKIDGFRFDGITSMLYLHHGLGPAFDSYERYFDSSVDEDALSYLYLANKLIHKLRPDAISIAEDVSGMPGLAAPIANGGIGFDYRLAMGVPDCWFKLMNDIKDEDWNMSYLWHELTNRRGDEKTIGYAECHDQAIVGGKTIIFELIDAPMYHHMQADDKHIEVDRGMALHKMIRLATISLADHGYLNFIGNEFGHPEWIDFPREGNNWSYHYARRQWKLRDDKSLKYHFLADFDMAMIRAVKSSALLEHNTPRRLLLHDGDKIIAFERGGLFFFFNFHNSKSYTDYCIETPPGEYEIVMTTDDEAFGGHNRIDLKQRFKTQPTKEGNILKNYVSLYLPARTALVLRRK